MTPIQKAKEIINSFWNFYHKYYSQLGTVNVIVEQWLTTPEAAALLSGEDWKEDKPLSEQVQIMKQRIILNMQYSGTDDNAWEIAGLNGAISILKKYEPLPEPPKP